MTLTTEERERLITEFVAEATSDENIRQIAASLGAEADPGSGVRFGAASIMLHLARRAERAEAALRSSGEGPAVPDELRELSERASEGKFVAKKDRRRINPWRIENEAGNAYIADVFQSMRGDFDVIEANAALLAASVNFVRSLIAAPPVKANQEGGR